jgi:uncharacterized repeat protein (TIGR02543 family)
MWKSLLTLQEAVKTGCRFDGWYTDSSFQPASRIARISEDEYEDIVLYAKFTPVASTAVVNGETEVVNTPAAETPEEAVKNTVVEESNQTATDNIAELKTPEKAVIRSVENKKGNKIKVIIKSMADVTGYEIKYSTNKKFTKKTTKTLQTTKTTQTLKNLKKKTYYVKARAYQTDSVGNRTYGTWSKVKKVKVKK